MPSHIPERIVTLRERSNMSQRQLAQESSLSQATLSRIESGARPAQYGEVTLIAQALGLSLGAILDVSPLEDRVLVATRASKPSADAQTVKNLLVQYLELDEYLDLQGVGSR